jgi:hypothetical protein
MNRKTSKIFLIILFSLSFLITENLSAFGEIYQLQIDDTIYDIEYEIDGDVIAMDVDKETISLLIATENVKDSEFQIILPNELILAENNEFAVLVNGFEVGYEVIETTNTHLTFFVPVFTEEIEIIGTFVVPEFPLGSFLVLAAIIGFIVIFQKSKNLLFK